MHTTLHLCHGHLRARHSIDKYHQNKYHQNAIKAQRKRETKFSIREKLRERLARTGMIGAARRRCIVDVHTYMAPRTAELVLPLNLRLVGWLVNFLRLTYLVILSILSPVGTCTYAVLAAKLNGFAGERQNSFACPFACTPPIGESVKLKP